MTVKKADGQLLFLRGALRVFWFTLAVWLLAWLAWKNLPPSGALFAVGRTAEPSGFFGGFTPLDRAVPTQEGGVWYSDVSAEPVYFNVAAPRLYDAMRVRLRYKEEGLPAGASAKEGQPYLAVGARTDSNAWAFDLKPIDLPMLDQSGWSARQDGDLRIYERKPTARSAEEILNGSADHTAVIGVDPVRWGLKLPPLKKEQPVETVMAYPGSRRMYLYVQKGPFELMLGLRGPKEVTARVSLVRDGRTLLTRTTAGDGAVELTLSGARTGLYRVDFDAPETVTLVGVRTPHQRLAFLETDGAHLKFPDGAAVFEPEFPIVTWETDLASAESGSAFGGKAPYDAIVARYAPPTTDADGWRTAEAVFSLRDLAVSDGRVQMLLSAPAIKRVGGKIRIDRVELEYRRPPIELGKLLNLFTFKP